MGTLKPLTNRLYSFFSTSCNKPVFGNKSGTSLVEVIIGMVILAMLVAGLNAGVLSLVNTNKASKEIAAASNFGYEKLEDIRREDYTNITSIFDTTEGLYKYDVQVTEDGGFTQKKIEVYIKWPSSEEEPKHQISLSTIIAKP